MVRPSMAALPPEAATSRGLVARRAGAVEVQLSDDAFAVSAVLYPAIRSIISDSVMQRSERCHNGSKLELWRHLYSDMRGAAPQVAMVQAENKKLAEPLKKAKEELHRLKGMLGNHEKDKNALITTKAKLKVISKELEELRWEHEVLQQKYNQVAKEREEIQERFSTAILEIQQKAGLKYMLLEKKILVLREELEEREAALQVGPGPGSREEAAARGDILREKNRRIRELETELMLAAKRVSMEYGSESSSQASSDY